MGHAGASLTSQLVLKYFFASPWRARQPASSVGFATHCDCVALHIGKCGLMASHDASSVGAGRQLLQGVHCRPFMGSVVTLSSPSPSSLQPSVVHFLLGAQLML